MAAEQKYHSYELEISVIIKALRKYRVYLIGIKFKIVIDSNICTVKNTNTCTHIIRIWVVFLQDSTGFSIHHRISLLEKPVSCRCIQP